MTDGARSDILGRIRSALGRPTAAGAERQALERGLPARVSHIRPPVSDDAVAAFKDKAAANLIECHELAGWEDVPEAVARIVRDRNLPADISVAPALKPLAWPATLTVRSDKARVEEKVAVSRATAAIAETGTLVLCSGDTAPSSLTFAPEVSLIVIETGDIVRFLEDGLAAVKRRAEVWPRVVNLVSGPSRTADVAGIVVRPAHGPKAVHVLIVSTPRTAATS